MIFHEILAQNHEKIAENRLFSCENWTIFYLIFKPFCWKNSSFSCWIQVNHVLSSVYSHYQAITQFNLILRWNSFPDQIIAISWPIAWNLR